MTTRLSLPTCLPTSWTAAAVHEVGKHVGKDSRVVIDRDPRRHALRSELLAGALIAL